ncbi:MAG TPA: glycosyltransferase [Gammaproteobacteria bacterium]
MKTEVIIANYNKPEFLRRVLEGLLLQTDTDFTITIADDGSGPEIAQLVDEFRQRNLTIAHLWHEDIGFRKNLILNKAIKQSQADYLIFIDNDCIPEPSFVSDHKRAAREGYFVAGRRVNLGSEITRQIVAGSYPTSHLFSPLRLLMLGLRKQVRYAELGMHWPWWVSRLWSRAPRALLGCNMAMWRRDLLAINGFDAEAVRYGLIEDTDIEWRLQANGVRGGSLLGRGCVFHLDHPTRKSTDTSNEEYMRAKQARGEVWARQGIDTL